MSATLTWLDLTAGDRDKMRRVLDLFSEKGTLDELGLSSLRDGIANVLFPGTSTIQTRLRYVLFVAWMYQDIERSPARSGIASLARSREVAFIEALSKGSNGDGIIGSRAGAALTRLPSGIYWHALQRWGIFLHARSQPWYHTHFASLLDQRSGASQTDDPGIIHSARPNWHQRIPKPPRDFPESASFDLTAEEAVFLQGRIEENCQGSLLAWFAREGCPQAGNLWEATANLEAPTQLQQFVELARRFSRHVEGMPLLYNLMLAERRHADTGQDEAHINAFRARTSTWAEAEKGEQPFNPDNLWAQANVHGIRAPHRQREFIEGWAQRVNALGADKVADDSELRGLIEAREIRLKGPRARFKNKNRLLDWVPGVGVGRMAFRWTRARILLADLHQGLPS